MVRLLPLYHVPVARGGRGLDLSGIRQDLNGKEILLSRIRDLVYVREQCLLGKACRKEQPSERVQS